MKRGKKGKKLIDLPKLRSVRIYVAGPMSGYHDHNFPAFNEAARRLRAAGYEVVNPAELDDGDTTLAWDYYMKRDLPKMLTCHTVALLDGWQDSKGANLEVSTARAVGIEVMKYIPRGDDDYTLAPLDDTILDEAKRLTGGDRNKDYGHPLDDFSKTAAIWSAILGCRVTPEQVGLCMVGVKISRHLNSPKRDNLVDGAGYFRTIEMIVEEKERRRELRNNLELPINLRPQGQTRGSKRAS